MNSLIEFLGTLLGYVMYYCYQFLGNYGLSIILFTVVTKVIMFPLSLIAQKNSIIMVKMKPALEEISQRHFGNASVIAKEQKKLYKKEGYSTLKSVLPLLFQIPIILGLIQVIYQPMQHLLRLSSGEISNFVNQAAEILGTSSSQMGSGAQLQTMGLVQANAAQFEGLSGLQSVLNMDLNFLGMSIAEIPSFTSLSLLYPIISGLSALALAMYQNKYNVLQRSQSAISRWGMSIFLLLFSAIFAYFLPCGVGLYWIAGNLLSIPVLWLCNKIYDPGEQVDLDAIKAPIKLDPEEKKAAKELRKLQKNKEKADKKRFAKTPNKEIVFYSESNGFYKYFSGFIQYILTHSEDIEIHYVSSDYRDQIFELDNPRIKTYYIGPLALIQFMMLMDADLVVMTMPDLEQYHIKRSLVRKDIEYVYLDHGMSSFHLTLKEGALDHFDTIFCYGPNHIAEVRETEKVYHLPAKRLVKTGFPLLDKMLKNAADLGEVNNDPKRILIAPSWQKDNILEICLDECLRPLLHLGYQVTVRPHPEFVKRFPEKMKAIIERYKDELNENFLIQTDFSSSFTVYSADLVITDWSTIAQEFSYATKKPSLFINTPMKIVNPEYQKISLVPLDISTRDKIGRSINIEDLEKLPESIEGLFEHANDYNQEITALVKENIFDLGDGARGGGEYLIDAVKKRRLANQKSDGEMIETVLEMKKNEALSLEGKLELVLKDKEKASRLASLIDELIEDESAGDDHE